MYRLIRDHDIGMRGLVVRGRRSCTTAARGTGIATADHRPLLARQSHSIRQRQLSQLPKPK